jgi:hypothetical protein
MPVLTWSTDLPPTARACATMECAELNHLTASLCGSTRGACRVARWHAVVLLDQTGWHPSAKLNVPAKISLQPRPPRLPELNPTENVWQYISQYIGIRVP